MSSVEILDRITRPENCAVGFGIPMTVRGFHESHRQGWPHSFVRSCGASPPAYERLVIDPCMLLGAHMRRLGAQVVFDLTRDGYTALFHGPDTHAVILISHWGEDFIELQDGPAHVEDFIASIPESFKGVIDLCVCHPTTKLIPALRVRRPECVIPYIDAKANLIFWLYFYRDLMRILRRGTRSYLDALVELTTAHFATAQEVRT